jgi:hypothetical protein
MRYHIKGQSYACCSCNVGCPCAVGGTETAGSQGCAAVQVIAIDSGTIDGTDVSGAKLAAVVDWPGAMMKGDGTGRLYFDSQTTPEQRAALEALISGKLGGGFSRIPELITRTLSPEVAPIRTVMNGDGTTVIVGEFGQAIVKPIRRANGEEVTGSGPGGFRDELTLATGHGSWWRDPELRSWEGGGYAEQSAFDWRG